jgi:hypothetical protein
MNTPRRLTVALAAAAALTGTGYTVALAASPAPTTPPAAAVTASSEVDTASTAPTQRRGRLLTATERAQLKATGHTTVVRHTRKHGDVTLTVQTGHVGNASGKGITVMSRGGYGGTYALTPVTVVREGGARVSLSSIKGGDRVLVIATADGTARRIIIRRPAGNRGGAAA